MKEEITIRDAALPDSDEITRLTVQLGYAADAETVSSRLTRIINRPDQIVLVAILKEKVVGWLQAHSSDILESGFRVEIIGLVVSEGCRRRGIGRGLVQRAERWAIEIGADTVLVRSNTKRVESHSFYPALDFTQSKTQVVYRKSLRLRQ